MNADDLRAYKRRWQRVAEVERQEIERMSPAQKFADVAMRMGVARALGFVKEGHLRERWIVNGEISDSGLYGLLRRDFR